MCILWITTDTTLPVLRPYSARTNRAYDAPLH